LTGQDAEYIVRQGNHGDYMVFQTSSGGPSFYLVVHDHEQLQRFRISVADGKYLFGPRQFESLSQLMQMATTRPLRGSTGDLHLAAPLKGHNHRSASQPGPVCTTKLVTLTSVAPRPRSHPCPVPSW